MLLRSSTEVRLRPRNRFRRLTGVSSSRSLRRILSSLRLVESKALNDLSVREFVIFNFGNEQTGVLELTWTKLREESKLEAKLLSPLR